MRGLSLLVLLIGCVQSSETICDDGSVCPSSLRCDLTHQTCVTADQLTACTGLADGDVCVLTSGTGVCDANVCLAQQCGDGLVTGAEDCDGEITADCTLLGYYDAVPLVCSNRCTFDVQASQCTGFCGDGIVNGPPGSEICDGAPPGGGCIDLGFEAGRLGCNDHFCAPTFTNCRNIGFVARTPVTTERIFQMYQPTATRTVLATQGGILDVDGSQVTPIVTAPMYGVWGSGPADIHVVGFQGVIWHFDGTTWTETRASQPAESLNAVWGTTGAVFAAGSSERVLRNIGAGWQPFSGGSGSALWYAMWGFSATDLLVAGSAGRIQRYAGTWQEQDVSACWAGAPDRFFFGLWGSAPDDVYAVGRKGMICHFDGVAWTPQTSGATTDLYAISGRAANDIFAVGDGGAVVHFDGATWRVLETGTVTSMSATSSFANQVLVAGNAGELLEYAGAAFSLSTTSDFASSFAATGSAGSDYVSSDKDLYQWIDGQWLPVLQASERFDSLWVSPLGTALAYDNIGNVFHYDGATWTQSTTTFFARGIAGPSETDLDGYDSITGVLAHFDGNTWTPFLTPTTSITDLARGGDTVFAVGIGPAFSQVAYVCTGGSCASTVLPTTRVQTAVYAAAPNDAFIVGLGGDIFHYDGAGWTAMSSSVTTALQDIAGTSGHDVFAVGDGGVVIHYDGVGWSRVRIPVAPDLTTVAVRDQLVLIGGNSKVLNAIVRDAAW